MTTPNWGNTAYEVARKNPDVHIEDPDFRDLRSATRPDIPTEHEEQSVLFAWAAANEHRFPVLRWLYANVNGQYRRGQRPEAGMKKGVPDLFLPCARGGKHGLYVELKRVDRKNHPTPEQRVWIEALQAQGYEVAVCYGAGEAKEAIIGYLRGGK